MTILGPTGRVGVRNHVLVVPAVITAPAVVAERIAAAIAPVGAALPQSGRMQQLRPT
jgi:altronate dehydratase